MIKYIDESDKLFDLVQFNSNKYQPRHRWYNLTEGYSREFVRRLIGEQETFPRVCMDPFGGVGTTALTCQELGIRCYSIENNPFFYEVARAKLETNYDAAKFEGLIGEFETYLNRCRRDHELPDMETQTLFQHKRLEKWIFNKPVTNGILDITKKISELAKTRYKLYVPLFKIALGAHLVGLSNVYRNGKCLSYRNDWKKIRISRDEVHERFIAHCKDILLVDIRTGKTDLPKVLNQNNFYYGDCRQYIQFIPNNSVDLVITSPPYLNSRDYTDIYRLELWILGYVSKYSEEKLIRRNALTSHVQIQLEDKPYPKVRELKDSLTHLSEMNGSLWNRNIPNMVKGYFADMKQLFIDMHPKLTKGARVYINVSNSAYGRQIIEVDTILAKIAAISGYKALEIRTARHLSSSQQQQLHLEEKLRESVILLEKK